MYSVSGWILTFFSFLLRCVCSQIRPFTILAFSSGLFIHHLLLILLHHKTKFLQSISPKQCDIESWNMRQNV